MVHGKPNSAQTGALQLRDSTEFVGGRAWGLHKHVIEDFDYGSSPKQPQVTVIELLTCPEYCEERAALVTKPGHKPLTLKRVGDVFVFTISSMLLM
jgi:hypothetical protein